MNVAMNGQQFNATSGLGKKAVHVKWAGKTIALGTFPAAEADEKCARAKALTRAWRSTMRPKPSREWVMLELERLGVRVVSGRLGRKVGEDGEESGSPMPETKKNVGMPQAALADNTNNINMPAQRNNSIGWGMDADLSNFMARRNSSLGLSMMSETLGRRGSLSSLGPMVGFDSEPAIPPHRPLVGGGAAAAYEAARHDHFTQRSAEQQRRASSLGLGSLTNGGLGGMGMSVNPNQHYEMLKLHHMNLLNEIQETTLMMNLYQQQQLQQQQQQLEQRANSQDMMRGGVDQMSSMFPGQNNGHGSGLDQMFGAAQLHRSSLGLGGSQLGVNNSNFNEQQFQMMQQLNSMGGNAGQNMLNNNSNGSGSNNFNNNMMGGIGNNNNNMIGPNMGALNQQDMSNRVAHLKEEVVRQDQGNDTNSTKKGGTAGSATTADKGVTPNGAVISPEGNDASGSNSSSSNNNSLDDGNKRPLKEGKGDDSNKRVKTEKSETESERAKA